MSQLAGRSVEPPRRETLQDLIDSRAFWLSLADLDGLPAGVDVHEGVVLWDRGDTTLTAEVYVPQGEGPFPLLAHFHGGGYCTGGVLNDRKAAMRMAARGYTVISPEYSLAPEHPFPRAVEESVHTAHWLVANAAHYRGDPSRLVLEGGSAGAGLAVAVTLAAQGLDDGLELGPLTNVPLDVSALVLFYGLFSFPLLLLKPGSNVGPAELWSRAYLGPHFTTKLRHPLVSAVYAPGLDRLPPAYLACGSEDSMLGHTLELAKALAEAGGGPTVSVAPGLDHSYVKMVDSVPEAAAEIERAFAWLAERVPPGETSLPA